MFAFEVRRGYGGHCFWWYKTQVSDCNRYVRLKYTHACKSWQDRKHRDHVTNITKQKYKCQFLTNTNTDTNLNTSTNTNASQFLSSDKIWCRLCSSCKNIGMMTRRIMRKHTFCKELNFLQQTGLTFGEWAPLSPAMAIVTEGWKGFCTPHIALFEMMAQLIYVRVKDQNFR